MKRHQNSDRSIWPQNPSDKTYGRPLIEALLLVILTGILAAICLPNNLTQTSREKQVESRNNVGAMNRAQQAYFEEKKGAFADSIEEMGIGIRSDTASYRYFTQKTDRAALNYAISKAPKVKSYVGAVWKVPGTDGKNTTQAILCEAKNSAATKLADPIYKDGQFICGEGTVKLGD